MTASNGIYRIESIGRGYLAIAAHPASEGDAGERVAEIAASGIQQLVCLLQAEEARQLGLEREDVLVSAQSMQFVSFPIPDMGLPASVEAFSGLTRQLYRQVQAGTNSLIHCRAGIGRSGLVAAAVLMQGGLDARQAFARVAQMRGRRLPETREQGAWLEAHQSVPGTRANPVSRR